MIGRLTVPYFGLQLKTGQMLEIVELVWVKKLSVFNVSRYPTISCRNGLSSSSFDQIDLEIIPAAIGNGLRDWPTVVGNQHFHGNVK